MALSGITRKCRRAVLLSGTPALSRPAELFTQLTLIEPGLFPSYTEFGMSISTLFWKKYDCVSIGSQVIFLLLVMTGIRKDEL